jgi:hypothetical protein
MLNSEDPRNRRTFVAGVATLPAVALFLSLSSPAGAASYTVSTCRAPDGTPAATRDTGGGWASESRGTMAGGGNLLADDCAASGAVRASLANSARQAAPSWLYWRFFAPPSTRINEYAVNLDGYSRPGVGEPSHGDVGIQSSLQMDPEYSARFNSFGRFWRHTIQASSPGATYVQIHAGCTPAGPIDATSYCDPGNDGAPARFNVYYGTFELEDLETPAVSNVSGDAVSDAVWTGATAVSVSANDAGGGVYRLGVEVDGQVRGRWYMAGGTCRPYGTTERHFLSPRPCPTTVSTALPIATADLPDGKHVVRIFVEDVAGNQATVYGPTTKTLRTTSGAGGDPSGGDSGSAGGTGGAGGAADGGAAGSGARPGDVARDPGPLNGTPAVSDARLRAQWQGRESPTRSVAYDGRPTITGQLTTPTGQPIVGAFIRTTITRRARNSPAFERNSLKTDSSGRFRWAMPRGVSSQSIRLSYHQRVFDTTPVAMRTLRLDVAAGVRLNLSRKAVRRGQAVRLSGVVVGRPMPKLGKVVELQARNAGGRWLTFKTVRSTKSGRFSAVYRFRKPGPAVFQMRARTRRSGDYPYGTGSSPARRIVVR